MIEKFLSFYRKLFSVKVLTFIIMTVTFMLISGFPAYVTALLTQGKVAIAMPDLCNQTVTLKHVAFTPVAMFMYVVGFVGLLGMMQVNNPKYKNFAPLCYAFIFGSYGCLTLLSKFTLI